ncbi:MAG TPA: NAD(P)-binding domain-containing protein, partial [Vicinamibacteria bacterium]|nr:NAD(P)-binding domain-containing protein [Vicinamibacteria bacterium]
WGHVRVFSPWQHNVDPASAALLAASGWKRPPDAELPTGNDLVDRYLRPLADLPAIRPHLRLGTRVRSVSRLGMDRTKTSGRDQRPFVLRVESGGVESDVLARAVIDASGTYGTPNPLGANGLPAIGEAAHADRIFYGIPDVLGADRSRYASRRVLVVGSGHSAFNVLLDLASLVEDAPDTVVHWAIRRETMGDLFGGGTRDQLEERGRLGQRMRALVARGALHVHAAFHIKGVTATAAGIVVRGEGSDLPAVDEIVATTGFRPDMDMLREMRLDLDPIVESPSALAPLIDPNAHSCGTVPPHGAEELRQPEKDFYVVGMKSYGRAPTFLMLTGYEQVRSVVCALTGDEKGAREVKLVLPETGVCSTGALDGGADSCCGGSSEAVPVALSLTPGARRSAGCG